MTDETTDRTIELEIEVPGTPEEVWTAIATGPGITSWFIPMEVDERAGGEVRMDWGTFGRDTADVVAWEPPTRVVFHGRGESALAFEWLVEARDGGSCVVRLVNSGFGEGDHWDDQYDGMSEGWKIFLENLRLHCTHFRGQVAQAVIPTVMLPGPNAAGWAALTAALGLPADAGAGDRIETGGDAPPLAGRVEAVMDAGRSRAYLLLLESPNPGTGFVSVEGDGDRVAASVYLYLYDAELGPVDGTLGERWTKWLTERFGAPAEAIG